MLLLLLSGTGSKLHTKKKLQVGQNCTKYLRLDKIDISLGTILRCLLASEGEGGAAVLVRNEMANGKLVIGQEGGSASMIMEKVLLLLVLVLIVLVLLTAMSNPTVTRCCWRDTGRHLK